MCLVSATQRIRVSLTALSPPHASGKFHDVRLVARTHAAARLPLFLMASSLGALAAALRDSLRRGRLQREQDTLDQEYVPHYADTYVPEPPYCTYQRLRAACSAAPRPYVSTRPSLRRDVRTMYRGTTGAQYTLRTARPSLVRTVGGAPKQAALSLWYVQRAGAWYA